MSFLAINYTLTLNRTEDRGGDEPRLQFAFVTNVGGTPTVTVQDTGQLASNFPNRRAFGAGTRTLPLRSMQFNFPPTEDQPFLGLAVRAIENDSSSQRNRDGDLNLMENSILGAVTPIFAANESPDVNTIWLAANAPGLRDRRFKDDDDKIGVSARVFPNLGRDMVREGDDFATEDDTFTFIGDGADWDMNWNMRCVSI